ncbi:hypothetical protein WR25_08137 [Diploscapter pachys]|uniref:Macrophage erythroblast attacher n=1 Tax=Diploscapter pachys TaxID=2018661 RepID=A0A2A2KPF5_9BILA|nr:hypothetical protein WR25_08137 [Diploscapter pachys]
MWTGIRVTPLLNFLLPGRIVVRDPMMQNRPQRIVSFMMVKPSVCESSTLEYSTFRVPYEELNRKFRNGHKILEKNASTIKRASAVIKQKVTGAKEPIPVETVANAFNLLSKHAPEMQKAVTSIVESQKEVIAEMRRRIAYLREQSNVNPSTHDELQCWSKSQHRTARLISQYLMRCGHLDIAKDVSDHFDVAHMLDFDVFQSAKQVEKSLRVDHNTKPCMKWIDEHRSKLKRMNSKLEINMRTQEVIELVREGKSMKAIEYIRTQIPSNQKSDFPDEIQTMMGVISMGGLGLAMKNESEEITDDKMDTDRSNDSASVAKPLMRLQKYFSDERWHELADQFNRELFRLYQLPSQSAFSMALQCGLAAHKTPMCHDEKSHETACPACNKKAWAISHDLPLAHITNSRILCGLTGDVLNEDNVPYIFPSGHVYGLRALESLRESNGIVKCPATGEICQWDELLRVYIICQKMDLQPHHWFALIILAVPLQYYLCPESTSHVKYRLQRLIDSLHEMTAAAGVELPFSSLRMEGMPVDDTMSTEELMQMSHEDRQKLIETRKEQTDEQKMYGCEWT